MLDNTNSNIITDIMRNLVKHQIEQEIAAFKSMGIKHFMFNEWLLANGESMGPRIKLKGKRLMIKKQCYSNSLQTLLYGELNPDEWFYCEGVFISPDLPILINHAWLVNRKGEVLDRTLRGKGHSYFGVPFKFDFVREITFEQGYYGILLNEVMYNAKIVSKPVGKNRAWKKAA